MQNSVQVVWTFILDYTRGWGVRRHHHDYFQMYYCLSGAGTFFLDGKNIPLEANTCILIFPNQEHELYPIQSGQLRLIDTKFYVQNNAITQALYAMPQSMQINDLHFRELQTSVRNEWVSGNIFSKEVSNLLFEQSIYSFLRKNMSVDTAIPFYHDLEERVAKLTGLEKRIADYQSLHFLENPSLDRLAGDLGYSKNHLCKVFKTGTGITISEYANFLRIRKAYDLICYTDKKLSEISVLCGFSSLHYFSRTFHRITGMPPSHARDQDRRSLHTDILLHGTFQYRYFTDRPDWADTGDPTLA